MSEEEKVSENDSEPLFSKSPNLTTDEALAKLEDHRCAICQNIIINACRIDCGHTFCRHCLNVDRENRSHGTKSTCFICDAAVTEMTHNAERDKEIDDIYATLPTNERLSRARAKAERAVEEESFNKRPRESSNNNTSSQPQHESDESSGESFGSGDASFSIRATNNVAADAANACHWNNASHSQNETGSFPTFYSGNFRVWRNDNYYDFPHEFSTENHHDDSNEPDMNTTNRDRDMFNRPPIVIHHTIQHVYHSMEVRNRTGESDNHPRESCSSSLRHGSSQLSMDGGRRYNNNASRLPTAFHHSPSFWRGLQGESCTNDMHHQNQRSHPPPPAMSYHNRSSSSYTNSSQNYCHNMHPHCGFQFHNPITYASASTVPCFLGFYPNQMSENRSSLNNGCYYQNARNYCHGPSEHHMHASPFNYERESSFQPETERESESIFDEDYLNLTHADAEDERDFEDEGLCEFHRAARNHSSSHSTECSRCSLERRSFDALPPHSESNDAFHTLRHPSRELVQDGDDLEDSSNDEDQVISFRISVPMPNVQVQVQERHEAIQRCRSSPEFIESRVIRGHVRDSL